MPINAIDLDGLEYLVVIHGPYETTKFLEYLNSNDVISQRAMLYYALHNNFKDDGKWVNQQTFMEDQKPPNNRAVEVHKNQNFKGVLVIMAKYNDNKDIIFNEKGYYFPPADGLFEDKFYPIDTKLFDEGFYKDEKGNDIDFFGIGSDINFSVLGKVAYQRGRLYTYTKGLGFRKFKMNIKSTRELLRMEGGTIGAIGSYHSESVDEQVNYGSHQIFTQRYSGEGSSFSNGLWNIKIGSLFGVGAKLPKNLTPSRQLFQPSSTMDLTPYEIDQSRFGNVQLVDWEAFLNKSSKTE